MLKNIDKIIGICLIIASIFALFAWIPNDSETGFIEIVRRRAVIGDAFAPTIAALICVIAALSMLFKQNDITSLYIKALYSFVIFIILFSIILLLMRYIGPLSVDFLFHIGISDTQYRPMRGVIPIKYMSFVIAGALMIFALSCYIDKQYHWRRFVLCLSIALMVALIFDLPFEDIILPPNGDV